MSGAGGATVVAMADARAAGAEAQDWVAFANASAAAAPSSAASTAAAGVAAAGALAGQAAAADDESTLVAFCGSWLALTARQAPCARQALLLLAEYPGQPYRAVAAWPDPRRDLSAMGPAAQQALREACGLATDVDGGPPRPGVPARLAFPVAGDGRTWAVVVLDLADGAAGAVQEGLRALHWGSGWLLAHLQSRQQAVQAQRLARSQLLNELSALALEAPRLDASALAVANRLAAQFGCSRVAVGFDEQGSMRPLVLSHSAQFDPRSDTVRSLAEAMDEAADLGRPLAALIGREAPVGAAGGQPDAAATGGRGGAAVAGHQAEAASAGGHAESAVPGGHAGAAEPGGHAGAAVPGRGPSAGLDASHTAASGAPPSALVQAAVARRLQVAALASIPIRQGPVTLGALTLERLDGPGFAESELQLLQQAATWLAPVWALQQAQQRPLKTLLRDRLTDAAPALRRPGTVLVAGIAGLALLASLVVPLPYRVSARSHLEGLTQRAVLAPFDGYLAEAMVRAGDVVRAGQPLARLDDRDQRLEVARWQAERDQQQRRWQIAMAQGDRAAAGVATAQAAQSDAMLALARDRLARATLVAPADGVVVSGDWQHQIGVAVENGRTLFELAPPDGHRVVLKVDDADIAQLQPGQRGELVLASLPQQAWPFTVSTVMPVANASDGRNLFRVEARLDASDARLRPGMEGVAKVHVDQRSALWVATHGLVDWLRVALWGLAP